MIGGATRGQQRHHCVHDTALIDQLANALGTLGSSEYRACGFACEQFAQVASRGFIRVHKCGAGHMQAHRFQEQLVAISCAIKRARTLAVIGLALSRQQFSAPHQTLRGLLAHFGFVVVGQARSHRPSGHKNCGQMPKMQSTNKQARHDLVAHAEHQRRVKHIVRERNRRALGDVVSAEKRKLHAGCALRYAIAHGRHAACHLRGCAMFAQLVFDDVREASQRRVSREHVVVGVDDGDIRRFLCDHFEFVIRWQGSKSVRNVRTAHAVSATVSVGSSFHLGEVGAACCGACALYALRDLAHSWMEFHDFEIQCN